MFFRVAAIQWFFLIELKICFSWLSHTVMRDDTHSCFVSSRCESFIFLQLPIHFASSTPTHTLGYVTQHLEFVFSLARVSNAPI